MFKERGTQAKPNATTQTMLWDRLASLCSLCRCTSFQLSYRIISNRMSANEAFPNIVHWAEFDRGGHFAAFEVPELYVDDIRTCFGQFR